MCRRARLCADSQDSGETVRFCPAIMHVCKAETLARTLPDKHLRASRWPLNDRRDAQV